MYGSGMIIGLWITLKRFFQTFITDLRYPKKYYTEDGIRQRMKSDTSGIFTVQYPEEKLIIPEEFRYIPFLVYEEVNGVKEPRCTACGICSKVCPPQCIYIKRKNDPETGRPVQSPEEFFIDIDVCMNCGLCAEFCPFDAILDFVCEASRFYHIYHEQYSQEQTLNFP